MNAATKITSRRFVLNQRPEGEPDDKTFNLETVDVPTPQDGQILVRNYYLSIDPYMRGRLSDRKSYAEPVKIGETMVGGTISKVIQSKSKKYSEGDWLVAVAGWQEYAVLNEDDMLFPLDDKLPNKSWALGILGMPGFTAWAGLNEIGKPKKSETLVVAAATGPVGSMVGQLAKHYGLRVVGVAGGEEKCRIGVEKLGFDACIDHRAGDFEEQLKKAVPDGIDIYYENVGGRVFDAVVPLLNTGARIPLCGTIANYNTPDQADDSRADRSHLLMSRFLTSRITVRGFIIYEDFGHLYPEFIKEVSPLVSDGTLAYLEDMEEGLENAPQALVKVLSGQNFGKKVIQITKED